MIKKIEIAVNDKEDKVISDLQENMKTAALTAVLAMRQVDESRHQVHVCEQKILSFISGKIEVENLKNIIEPPQYNSKTKSITVMIQDDDQSKEEGKSQDANRAN